MFALSCVAISLRWRQTSNEYDISTLSIRKEASGRVLYCRVVKD